MKYLYGDSSPSPIQINFIDFLRDFVDVSDRVATNAIGVGLIDGVDLITANVLAIGTSNAKMSRHGFQSVSRELARRVVVSPNGVECVDQLAPRGDEACLTPS